MVEKTHVTWHPPSISRTDRERLHGHQGFVVWFTGLSGCGKSTVANLVDHRLYQAGIHSYVLDGDNIRHGLCAGPAMLAEQYGGEFAQRFGLGFSPEDRQENIRRIGAVAQLFAAAGVVALTAFVSPYRRDRQTVRQLVEKEGRPGDFVEVFVDAPLEICESRDPKGLYRKARAGELKDFTGIDAPYEPPDPPDVHLDAANQTPDQLADQVVAYLRSQGKIP